MLCMYKYLYMYADRKLWKETQDVKSDYGKGLELFLFSFIKVVSPEVLLCALQFAHFF